MTLLNVAKYFRYCSSLLEKNPSRDELTLSTAKHCSNGLVATRFWAEIGFLPVTSRRCPTDGATNQNKSHKDFRIIILHLSWNEFFAGGTWQKLSIKIFWIFSKFCNTVLQLLIYFTANKQISQHFSGAHSTIVSILASRPSFQFPKVFRWEKSWRCWG